MSSTCLPTTGSRHPQSPLPSLAVRLFGPLPKVLDSQRKAWFSRWDDEDITEDEANMEHGARAQSAVEFLDGVETRAEGKSVAFGLGDK